MKHAYPRNIVLACVTATALAACATGGDQAEDATRLEGDVLITNVQIASLEGEGSSAHPPQSILIDEGRIIYIGAHSERLIAADTINASGLTAIPGLTDMHVHVWDEAELGAYLAHGVTTVRNMSGMPFHLTMADRIESGEVDGPRLLTTGPILNSAGPNQQLNHQIVETADEARHAVQWQYDHGFRHVKIYSNLTPEAYQAIREETDRLGMTLSGHTPEGHRSPGIPLQRDFEITFETLLNDDFLTIEHTESIVWHGLRGFHDEANALALAAEIAASDIPVTPTLLAHHNLYRVAQEGETVLTRPGTEWLNPFVQALEGDVHARWLSEAPEPTLRNDLFYQQMTYFMHEAGVTLVAGSDAGIFTNIPGLSLLEELTLLTQSGLTPQEALQTATVNTSRVLNEPDRGCLEEGCVADIVLHGCNPARDIRCLYALEIVVRAGRVYDRAALDALLIRATNTDATRSETNLMSGLAEQTLH